ncbi:hypothetical protein NX021_06565 [Cytobacillus firmus]|nr:hypothetical protein [Cytobacillus firmus]
MAGWRDCENILLGGAITGEHTHLIRLTGLSRCGSAQLMDEAALIWYVSAFNWANGAIMMQNSTMIHQNNAIISSSGA